jgi:hypothetical protein
LGKDGDQGRNRDIEELPLRVYIPNKSIRKPDQKSVKERIEKSYPVGQTPISYLESHSEVILCGGK